MITTKVSTFLGISIIIIFLLYWVNLIKTIPCNNDLTSAIKSHFIHTDPFHIVSNLYALYAISRVEQKMSSKKFILLILFIVLVSSVLEVVVHKIIPSIPCSIGFSGVLFGLMTWELVTEKTIDIYLLSSIVMLVYASSRGKNISLSGHAIGAFTGSLAGLMYRAI